MIKIPDGTLLAFGRLEKRPIADGFQEGVALAVELFKAQRLVVAGTVADGEATEAGEAGEIEEAVGILDEGDKEMSADDADPRDGLEVVNFREGPAGLEHVPAGLVLSLKGVVQQFVKEPGLRAQQVMRQLAQPALPVGGSEDRGAGGEEAPVLEEGFDLEFEPGLTPDSIIVSLGGAFEEDARVVGGLPDGFVFIQAKESGQRKGITPVLFVGMGTDEAIMAGIADDELLNMRTQELGDPAGEIGFFEHEALVAGGDGLDMLDQGVGLGAEAPPFEFCALIVELSQDTILGVGIEAQPCYRGSVVHNEPFIVDGL